MSIQETKFKAIADAIRAKTGETGTIAANDFATKIAAIPTGVAKPSWVQSTLPASANWTSVCYGDGKFVAVTGSTSIAAYSIDGINWTQTTLPNSNYWISVCYGDGKFVAVADGSIAAYSTDGINWTETTLPAHRHWNSVCYGGGKFVTVAYSNNIAAYSTDGITWTQVSMPATRNWYSVCYGGGKFVAITNGQSTYFAYLKDSFDSWA